MADDAVSVGRDILQQILSSQKKLEKQGEQQQKQLDKLEKALDRRSFSGAGGSSSGGGGGDDDMKPAALLKRLKAGKANAPGHFDAPYWMAALHARTENAQTCSVALLTAMVKGKAWGGLEDKVMAQIAYENLVKPFVGEEEVAELEADTGGGGDDDGDSLSALGKLLAAVAKHPEVMPKVRTLLTDVKTGFAEHVTTRTLGDYCGIDEAAFKKTDPDQLRAIGAKLQGLLKSEPLRARLGDGAAPPWPVGRLFCEEGGGGGGGGTSAAAESGAAESGAESDDEPELVHFPQQFQDLAQSLYDATGMDGSLKPAFVAMIVAIQTAKLEPPKLTSLSAGTAGAGQVLRLARLPGNETALTQKMKEILKFMLDADKCPTEWPKLRAWQKEAAKKKQKKRKRGAE